MSKLVFSNYSSIYVSLSDGQRHLIGCISEGLSETHQCLGMLSLPAIEDDVMPLIPKVLISLLVDGLPELLKECIFDDAWENAKQGHCLEHLSRTNQGAIVVEPPSNLEVGNDPDVDLMEFVVKALRKGWDYSNLEASVADRKQA